MHETKFFEERGVELSILEKPGYVEAKLNEKAAENVEILSGTEIIVLPPDAVPRNEGEEFLDWVDRVYSETEFAGYKLTASGAGEYVNDEEIKRTLEFVENGFFYNIRDKGPISIPILPIHRIEEDENEIWYLSRNAGNYYPVMVINWYKENPDENPNAEADVFEYIYCWWEEEFIIK